MRLSFADGQNIFLAWRMYVQMVSLSLSLNFLIWLLIHYRLCVRFSLILLRSGDLKDPISTQESNIDCSTFS